MSDYAKLKAAASETTGSDCSARGGGVIDTLPDSRGSVLGAQWGEAFKKETWWVVREEARSERKKWQEMRSERKKLREQQLRGFPL